MLLLLSTLGQTMAQVLDVSDLCLQAVEVVVQPFQGSRRERCFDGGSGGWIRK